MKPWPIITEDDEVQIVLPEFHDTYFGDTDTMTPEEWRIVHMISATPMLLAACKALVRADSAGALIDAIDMANAAIAQAGEAQ